MANCHLISILILLLLALHALSTSAAWNVSIDCGSPDSYTENSFTWIGDALLMNNGESRAVQHTQRALSTLRVFPTRKKNCYSINVTAAEEETVDGRLLQVLVRASFFYGNYDTKYAPPIFDLHFDGNRWTAVVTQLDEVVYEEAIYFVKRDAAISVCVAQTRPDQPAFISALEVRSLAPEMYRRAHNYSSALINTRRVAFSSSAPIVRYPEDVYDRIWQRKDPAEENLSLKNLAHSVDVGIADNPPQAVFLNAVSSANHSSPISLATNIPKLNQVLPIYVNLYFAEVNETITKKRSFKFYIDNEAIGDPIVPIFGEATMLNVQNKNASSETSFKLQATSGNTFPPLINALEVFTVTHPLSKGTNAKDVEALASLQSRFDALREWNGDPCLPLPYTWDWLDCSYDIPPRVTALHLGGYGLSGPLPNFSVMDALEIIDLHNNSLNGAIPHFLTTLPKLRELNLADNEFSGAIPSFSFNNTKPNINLSFSGNPNLCAYGNTNCHELDGRSAPGASKGPSFAGTRVSCVLLASVSAIIHMFVHLYT
ncbi:probable LRR receptor-like serine/threonine-protein kinase At1g05700 [Malania oleifera]|uniref:probable LRR receptor-like serine/threonine-protein kinase At1g05700 n=1 Tax=Malania oleifera TaxID=397392 RepID=UPI0025AE81D9|nr:probable LRR receptor-like serine/threonine-protein kinase At1g05700 [Malania oleifera]